MPNGGYDTRQLAPARNRDAGPIRVVTPARLFHAKGVSLAIRAFAAAGVSDMRLTVVGDGPERKRLERLARALGCGRIEFSGWLPQPELFEVLARSDVLLFPSLHEECGFVVVEAMAHGLVPVVVASGGPPVLAGGVGLAVPGGRRAAVVDAMAVHLRTLAAHPELRRSLQASARQRAQQFEWRSRLAEVRRVYGELGGASLAVDGMRLGSSTGGRSDA